MSAEDMKLDSTMRGALGFEHPQMDPIGAPERRFKVRFPDQESYFAGTAIEVQALEVPVANPKRSYISVAIPEQPAALGFSAKAADNQLKSFEAMGAEIVEDFRYDLDLPPSGVLEMAPEGTPPGSTLDDVLEEIRATTAWGETRGSDVVIAVIDTGIDGSRPEIPAAKRKGSWQPIGDTPWTDWDGHGTMCATIAAGTRAAGGVFDGVAPDAGVVACKTYFFDSELAAIYDFLIAAVDRYPDIRIVATNSFGLKTGTPPPPPATADFPDALAEAITRGIAVFFSAGNNHQLAGGQPAACAPNSIWLHKSRAGVMAVATCDLNSDMWYYSSRGPGQHFGDPNTNRKPDVTAPTPQNGRIVYGSSVVTLANGWGTSGASPQAAGLAALLWSKQPALSVAALRDAIRNGAVSLGHGDRCEGDGKIDCVASLALV
jgi:serine protease AprX